MLDPFNFPRLPLERFPLLLGCMQNLVSRDKAGGLCFHRSVALMLDLPMGEVCVGTLRCADAEEQARDPNLSPVPFIHCWVEQPGVVLAPTTIEAFGGELAVMPNILYYAVNGVHDVHRISRARIKAAAKLHKWERHFLKGTYPPTGIPLGQVVLDLAELPHTVNERGGVVPLPKEG